MGGEFQSFTLEDVCLGIYDCPHSTPKLSDTGPFMVRTQDIRQGFFDTSSAVRVSEEVYVERTKRVTPMYGDILFSREGTYFGDAAEVPENMRVCLGQRMVLIRPNPEIVNPSYLRIQINSPSFQSMISQYRDGTVAERLNLPVIRSLSVKVPSLKDQGHVVANIACLERKIELKRRMNATLEAMAQALFKSWFVDCDPVIDNALAAGNLIPEELQARAESRAALGDERKPLPEAIQKQFPSRFILTEEMGWVPEGWTGTRIKEVANVIKGKSYKSSELSESKTALVTLKSFDRGGGYRLDGLKEYIGEYKPEQEVFAGDLVIAYTDVTQTADVIGKPAMVVSDARYEHLVISLDVAVVRPHTDNDKYYLYGMSQTERFQDHTYSHSTGTTVLHLAKGAVPDFSMPYPGRDLVASYARNVKPMFHSIDKNITGIASLTKLRDTLLPKLLSGELRIPDAEKLAAEAV